MLVTVAPQACIGCTLCVQICPQGFVMDGDRAIAAEHELATEVLECCRQAVQDCLVMAIHVAS